MILEYLHQRVMIFSSERIVIYLDPGRKWQDGNSFYECDMSNSRFLWKFAGGCVKLHADNWIFGSNVTHGPQSDTTYSFGNVTYRFAMGGNERYWSSILRVRCVRQ
jgi:hypothetical protein